jgi:hypothetical protein
VAEAEGMVMRVKDLQNQQRELAPLIQYAATESGI